MPEALALAIGWHAGGRPSDWMRGVLARELARVGCQPTPDIDERDYPGKPRAHVCTPASLARARRRVRELTAEIAALVAAGEDPARMRVARKRQALERARLRRDYLKHGVCRRARALRRTGRPLSSSRNQREKLARRAGLGPDIARVNWETGTVWTTDLDDSPDGAGYVSLVGAWVACSRWTDPDVTRRAVDAHRSALGLALDTLGPRWGRFLSPTPPD